MLTSIQRIAKDALRRRRWPLTSTVQVSVPITLGWDLISFYLSPLREPDILLLGPISPRFCDGSFFGDEKYPFFKDTSSLSASASSAFEAIWLFAAPKQRVTRHKKRLKTTVQKRIPLRKNIITDPRTGELTLKHKLPFNWKQYLPQVE
jgi:ribosomal protein L32